MVVPFYRILCPWQFETTGKGIFSLSRATSPFPWRGRVFLVGFSSAFGASTMGFPHTVSRTDKDHSLRVVHAHSPKNFPNTFSRQLWVRLPLWTLGIDIDQPVFDSTDKFRDRACPVHPATRTGQLLEGGEKCVEKIHPLKPLSAQLSVPKACWHFRQCRPFCRHRIPESSHPC